MTVPQVVVELQRLLWAMADGDDFNDLLQGELVADGRLFASRGSIGGADVLNRPAVWGELERTTRWQRVQDHWLRRDALPEWGDDQPVRALELAALLRRSGGLEEGEQARLRVREAQAYRALGLQCRSLELLEEAHAFAQRSASSEVRLEVLQEQGRALLESGDHGAAKRLFEEARQLLLLSGTTTVAEQRVLCRVLTGLGMCEHAAGNYEFAYTWHHEALGIRRQLFEVLKAMAGTGSGDESEDLILARADVVESLSRLGHACHRANRHEDARRSVQCAEAVESCVLIDR